MNFTQNGALNGPSHKFTAEIMVDTSITEPTLVHILLEGSDGLHDRGTVLGGFVLLERGEQAEIR